MRLFNEDEELVFETGRVELDINALNGDTTLFDDSESEYVNIDECDLQTYVSCALSNIDRIVRQEIEEECNDEFFYTEIRDEFRAYVEENEQETVEVLPFVKVSDLTDYIEELVNEKASDQRNRDLSDDDYDDGEYDDLDEYREAYSDYE